MFADRAEGLECYQPTIRVLLKLMKASRECSQHRFEKVDICESCHSDDWDAVHTTVRCELCVEVPVL